MGIKEQKNGTEPMLVPPVARLARRLLAGKVAGFTDVPVGSPDRSSSLEAPLAGCSRPRPPLTGVSSQRW